MITCGVPFKVGELDVIKCSACKVTRPIKDFDRPYARMKRANRLCNLCNYKGESQ